MTLGPDGYAELSQDTFLGREGEREEAQWRVNTAWVLRALLARIHREGREDGEEGGEGLKDVEEVQVQVW